MFYFKDKEHYNGKQLGTLMKSYKWQCIRDRMIWEKDRYQLLWNKIGKFMDVVLEAMELCRLGIQLEVLELVGTALQLFKNL